MKIDWFTVIAQVLNFLILVWLMRRFLYKPILNAIDLREHRIAEELADAEAKKGEAQQERNAYQKKNEEFERQRDALLSQAIEEVKVERQRLLDEAHKECKDFSSKRQEELRNDAHNLNQAISLRIRQEVFAVTRRTLVDLSTMSLEECIGEVFIRRLREMDAKTKEVYAEALKTTTAPILIRSALDLPAAQRALIQNELNETFSAVIDAQFETAPDLVSGIELTTNGLKIAWNIDDYLMSLEKNIDELLKEKDETDIEVAGMRKGADELGA